MTSEDLHIAVYAVIHESRGLIRPVELVVDAPVSSAELDWFLKTSLCVRRVSVQKKVLT